MKFFRSKSYMLGGFVAGVVTSLINFYTFNNVLNCQFDGIKKLELLKESDIVTAQQFRESVFDDLIDALNSEGISDTSSLDKYKYYFNEANEQYKFYGELEKLEANSDLNDDTLYSLAKLNMQTADVRMQRSILEYNIIVHTRNDFIDNLGVYKLLANKWRYKNEIHQLDADSYVDGKLVVD